MDNKKSTLHRAVSRRSLLAGSAMGGIALALPSPLLAQQALAVTPLRNSIYLVSGAGSNTLVAVGTDAVLVVDGGLAGSSAAMLREIDNLAGGRPVTTLFNSNWRPEHRGLNAALAPTGVDIIAHENTRLWQNNDFSVDWEGYHHRPMPRVAQANKTFYKTGTLALGNETVSYGRISEFHTDGDIYIHFSESNILFAGDMLSVSTYPILDYVTGGWIGGAQQSTTGLLDMCDADTLVIPAAGAAQSRGALETQQQMLDFAYEQVAEAYRTGRSLEQFMAKAPMADYDAIYGDSSLFVRLLYRGTWYHVPGRAIRGII